MFIKITEGIIEILWVLLGVIIALSIMVVIAGIIANSDYYKNHIK